MLDSILENHEEIEEQLAALAPSGYTIALNLRHVTPEFFLSSYPEEWLQKYQARRYLLIDPVTVWVSMNTGATRWSSLRPILPSRLIQRLFDESGKFGLKFGAVAARRNRDGKGEKSYLVASRADRELSDEELVELKRLLEILSCAIDQRAGLSIVELETLQNLSDGLSYNDIAVMREVAPDTIKKRAERVRKQLGAKNTVHAVAIAKERGLI